jgi:AAA domain
MHRLPSKTGTNGHHLNEPNPLADLVKDPTQRLAEAAPRNYRFKLVPTDNSERIKALLAGNFGPMPGAIPPDSATVFPEGFTDIHEGLKGTPPDYGRRMEVKEPAQRSVREDVRAAGEILAFLKDDTPERRALLKRLGKTNDDAATRLLATLSRVLFNELDWREKDPSFLSSVMLDRNDPNQTYGGLNTVRLCEVEDRETEWDWHQRIPRGTLTLLNGDPDLGKSWLALDILSRITTGRKMPDGSPNPFKGQPRDVLWASDEDPDTVIKKRFKLLDGDTTRFHSLRFVRATVPPKGKAEAGPPVDQTLNLTEHLGYLSYWLKIHPLVAMVVLDPLTAFTGKVDTHRNSEVRAMLGPLMRLTDKHRISILALNHLNKMEGPSAMYRGMGSIAFVAASRSSWLVTVDPKETNRRLFSKIKCNYQTEDVGGLAFHVGPEIATGIQWEQGKVETSADEALRGPELESSAPARGEAKEWLLEALSKGPLLADDLWKQAEAFGLCKATVKAAAKQLGLKPKKTGGKGAPWGWSLPASDR